MIRKMLKIDLNDLSDQARNCSSALASKTKTSGCPLPSAMNELITKSVLVKLHGNRMEICENINGCRVAHTRVGLTVSLTVFDDCCLCSWFSVKGASCLFQGRCGCDHICENGRE